MFRLVFQNPTDVLSTSDALLLRFKTDGTIVSKGFSASYLAVESMNPSPEYSSQTDEDDVEIAFHKAAKSKRKKTTFGPSKKLKGGDSDDDDDDDDDDDGEDEDDEDEGMLAARAP